MPSPLRTGGDRAESSYLSAAITTLSDSASHSFQRFHKLLNSSI